MVTLVTAEVPRWNVFDPACPTRQVLDRLADKWTVLMVLALVPGTKRFGELAREIRGVSQKMLTQTLRRLERDGLVTRQIYPTVPPRVEYTLTLLGHSLVEPLTTIRARAEAKVEAMQGAQAAYDARSAERDPGLVDNCSVGPERPARAGT